MSQKNNKPKRSFVPQSIGDTVKKISRTFSSKFGRIEFIIRSNWPEIAGSYFDEYTEPKNISKLPDFENELGETIYKNYLNVSVAPAAALEFQHFKNTILEKINSYFGYKAIFDLRIQQNYIPKINNESLKMNNVALTQDENDLIAKSVEELNNSELKKSLIDLGKNITKESK